MFKINKDMCVLSTTDYSQFKRLEGNRVVSQQNIKLIIQSMNERQLIVPALVNEKNEIKRFQWKKIYHYNLKILKTIW